MTFQFLAIISFLLDTCELFLLYVSPSNECILDPSLNDYSANTAVNDSEAHLPLIRSPEPDLDDSEQNNIQSNLDLFPVIDLTKESSPKPQHFVSGISNNEPHYNSSVSSSHNNQSSITSPQVPAIINNTTARSQFEAYSSITVDSHGYIVAEAQTQGPMMLLPNSSAKAVCSVTDASNFVAHATIVLPSSVSSPENGCTSTFRGDNPSNSNTPTTDHALSIITTEHGKLIIKLYC